MCGIVGFKGKVELQEEVLHKMCKMIEHRGPDGQGCYFDGDVALGHQRLAIVDVEGGKQPMHLCGDLYTMIFNGEIYNYQTLRVELERQGCEFESTHSDTEVIIQGYYKWGIDVLLEKIEGMFSFVIWDKKKQELILARDHFGIKPLYYYHTDECFLFGSEIKSFLAHPKFNKALNVEQLPYYLSYQYSPSNKTFFKDVLKVMPGSYVVFKHNTLEHHQYFEITFDQNKDDRDYSNIISKVMNASVDRHKMGDVEVASFLSSGVDSSYIATLAKPSKTFTVGYNNKIYDESANAHAYSKIIDVENYIYYIDSKDYFSEIANIQYYNDEPLGDASAVSLYFLNKLASKHVKVCLSGEGADEMFGGYNVYKDPIKFRKFKYIPTNLKKSIYKITQKTNSRRGINFIQRICMPIDDRYIGVSSLFNDKDINNLLKTETDFKQNSLSKPLFNRFMQYDDVTKMQYTDFHLWLVGDILKKADSMSMAHSIELRVPFLDKQVYSLARTIPTNQKVSAKQTKIALRNAAKKVMPEYNADKKKLGFPVPIKEWLQIEQYKDEVCLVLRSEHSKLFFNEKFIEQLLHSHFSKKTDHWRKVWAIYCYLKWYEEYFIKR